MTAAPDQTTQEGDAHRRERLRALTFAIDAQLAELGCALTAAGDRAAQKDGYTALLLADSRACVTTSLALLAKCRA